MFDKFAPLIVTLLVAVICGFTISGKQAQVASACDTIALAQEEKTK